MAKSFMLGLIAIAILGVILGVIFMLDDVTVIGQIIDPLEFAFVGIIGYLIGRKL
jgi:hypothetical protein